VIEASVSNIDLYRIWKEQESLEVEWLINKILIREQTEKMMAGEAFHKAVELSEREENFSLSANDYVFHFPGEIEIVFPALREVSLTKEYEGLLVKGRVDGLGPRLVSELKTTEQFDPDRYLEGLQWRFYLDMAEADRFDWHIFQMSQCGEREYEIFGYHPLTQYRYARMHDDCLKAAREYKHFAEKFLEPAKLKLKEMNALAVA
jgi:hypothetical protein